MKKAEKVWTFKSSDKWATPTDRKSSPSDQPHFIIAAKDVPTDDEIASVRGGRPYSPEIVAAVRHVLNELGLEVG